MLGFEANGDKVKSASFAPMLNNVNGTQWGYDLINFDSSRLCVCVRGCVRLRKGGYLRVQLRGGARRRCGAGVSVRV